MDRKKKKKRKTLLVFPIVIPLKMLKGQSYGVRIRIIEDFCEEARLCLIEKLKETING